MEELSLIQQEEISKQISQQFNGEASYVNCNRFVLKQPEIADIEGDKRIFSYILFDENQNVLSLNKYAGIFPFRNNVAVVCIANTTKNEIGGFKHNKKFGLIDTKGKELIPCLYEKVEEKLGGSIEVSLDGVRKFAYLADVLEGRFDWEKCLPLP